MREAAEQLTQEKEAREIWYTELFPALKDKFEEAKATLPSLQLRLVPKINSVVDDGRPSTHLVISTGHMTGENPSIEFRVRRTHLEVSDSRGMPDEDPIRELKSSAAADRLVLWLMECVPG